MNNKILQGYTISRSVEYPFFIPTNIQSKLLRNYCKEKNFKYKLHLGEFNLKNSTIQLYQIINNSKNINGILTCSITFLPNNLKKLIDLFKLIKSKKLEFHFIFDEIIFKNQNVKSFSISLLKELNKIKSEYNNR